MTSALTIRTKPSHTPLAAAKRLFGSIFRRPAVMDLNRHELSDHLLRDIGVFDGDRSDG